MKRTKKNIISTISILTLTLLATGCAPKNPDGSYQSVYSYHPYNQYNSNPSHQSSRSYTSSNRFNQFNTHYSSTPIGNSIETTAKSLLGIDYQYGATGPYQYDCSGFTQYVFSKQGIKLPRVSREQAKVGEYVRASELQKGDLIFFDSKNSSKVSHVGIYLGNGKFIHASSSKDRVVISSLNSSYYRKHFKWGRRVTNLSYARR